MQINPYLFFDGNCEEAFKFYASLLGGKIDMMLTHAGTPAVEYVPADWVDKIMHARMTIGDNILMASDAPPGRYDAPKGYSVSVVVTDPAEAERIFTALAEGGKIVMPFEETFWALRFGMLVDRFGIPWMINCDRPT